MDDTTRGAVAQRLLQAWSGEIQAGQVYELIARRERDARRADILRRMAEAEAGHRTRLEARMRELGITVPDPGSVGLSRWQRWQARIAPVGRLLAAREAAEDDEVAGVYKDPTGDDVTDRLLEDIRRDERSHSRTVSQLRAGEAPIEETGEAATRLDRLIGRERGHVSSTGWISGAIYGANDGLAAVFGIVSGVSGATGGSEFVLTAGLAGAIASSLSMATGAYLAESSVSEVAEANLERERQEIAEHPEEEREELSLFLQLKGLSAQDADALAQKLSPDALLNMLAAEELGGATGGGNPIEAAAAGGISTAVGAFIPVIPFFFTTGTPAIVAAAVISLLAHFAIGAAKSLVTLRSWWGAGLEMTLAGAIVGGATYLIGLALPT